MFRIGLLFCFSIPDIPLFHEKDILSLTADAKNVTDTTKGLRPFVYFATACSIFVHDFLKIFK